MQTSIVDQYMNLEHAHNSSSERKRIRETGVFGPLRWAA